MPESNILGWASRWHYPQLALDQRNAIRAGRASWEAFEQTADAVQMIQALDRIARWNERAGVAQEEQPAMAERQEV